MGTTTAPLLLFSGTNPDTADTLAVNLAESGGVLSSGSAADAALGNTLCIVDSELISYETAALTSANHYSLTTLYRGLYNSGLAAHSAAAPFARLDNAIFKYDLPAQYVGQPLYLKFQSFNVFGGGVEALSSCTAYTNTPTGGGIDHPVAEAALTASSLDFGPVTAAPAVGDDFGRSLTLAVEYDVDFGAV
jgi:hypothetical protein